MAFRTSIRRFRLVYVEANRFGHWIGDERHCSIVVLVLVRRVRFSVVVGSVPLIESFVAFIVTLVRFTFIIIHLYY